MKKYDLIIFTVMAMICIGTLLILVVINAFTPVNVYTMNKIMSIELLLLFICACFVILNLFRKKI
jgi:DMSO reductase anchor subunit